METKRKRRASSIAMVILLVGLFALIYMNKESIIEDFPVLISVIHIYQDNEILIISHDSERSSYYLFEK
ncbi:hypothetical protein [Bacillus sp. H1a]|uniref:hypothetical protein n=1 Tax=Bacillus sp. H1a TaxID=1397276 RepID=UPI00046858EC|nr:hypothetical protein [Bacillus sp. H1a]